MGALVHRCIGALVHGYMGALVHCSLARLSKDRPSVALPQGAWVTQEPVGITMLPLERRIEERAVQG